MRKNERMALNEIVESLNEIHNNLEKEKDSSLNSDEYLFDYYLTDAKDLVWNLFADKFLAYEGADAELQSIRSWNELKGFANRFGTMVVENED